MRTISLFNIYLIYKTFYFIQKYENNIFYEVERIKFRKQGENERKTPRYAFIRIFVFLISILEFYVRGLVE